VVPRDAAQSKQWIQPEQFNIYFIYLLLFTRNHNETITCMRQDSETIIIMLNTALKYKIPSRKKATHKHIVSRAIVSR